MDVVGSCSRCCVGCKKEHDLSTESYSLKRMDEVYDSHLQQHMYETWCQTGGKLAASETSRSANKARGECGVFGKRTAEMKKGRRADVRLVIP